ncbi:MAG: hypothetical protein ACTHJW_02200 [Streptosporangiaceae bacterium]
MTDIETELRDAMAAAVAGARPRADMMALVRSGHRQRKLRAAAASAAAVAVVLAAAAAVAAVRGGHDRPAGSGTPSAPATAPASSPPAGVPPPAPPPGWVRHRDDAGDFIDTPRGWHVSGLPALVAPAVRWVIGTGPVPNGGSCAPTAALGKLPAGGALFAVMEYVSVAGQAPTDEPYTFPPRARRLGLGPLGGPMECWGVRTNLLVFEDGGRYFQVQTVFGPSAPASLRAQVTRSLNTLRIAPAPAREQPAALCRTRRWTYCRQAAWVYQVIRAAHVTELGNVGTRAIAGLAGNRSFGMWTTRNRAGWLGGRCHLIAGSTVCRVDKRLGWRVHGLVLWLQPAASPYSTPPVRPGLPSASVLRRMVEASRHVTIAAAQGGHR